MWFWLAIAAMLMWSGSDLFSKIGSKPDDKLSHWKMVMCVGLVMGLHAAYEVFVGGVNITLDAIVRYLPASALYISSMVMGYVALRYIELSISSPICNSSGAIAALLCFIFLGQRLNIYQGSAVILVCLGVVGLGIVEFMENEDARMARQEKANVKYSKSLLAILLPVLYCFLDAAGTFADMAILENLDEDVANVAYELTFLMMGILSFIYVKFIRKQKLVPSRELPKLTAGIFETAGQFAYIYAISSDKAIAAAPIISAYCAVSVVWSRIFLKEKLSLKHYIAIVVTIVGIVIIGATDA